MTSGRDEYFSTEATGLNWLTPATFEIRLRRPADFSFQPGQKIGLIHGDVYREYSLIGAAGEDELAICVRLVKGGALSPILSRVRSGDMVCITRPFGHFLYQSSRHPAVFVATGTGVAPFVAYARAGVSGFLMLHGVHATEERYYRQELAHGAQAYIACIPEMTGPRSRSAFPGRVTEYLAGRLDPGAYDFYLCGRREMIRDTMGIIDRRFPDSRVFTEIFF